MVQVVVQLTEKQWQEIRSANQPVRITNPQFKQEYVVVPAATFDCLMELHYEDGEPTKEEIDYHLYVAGKMAGWFEPEMDVYDNYDVELKKLRAKQDEES